METNFKSRTVWTGDNLDVLRGINSECVDLIYLDPPFNSNRQYAAPIGSKAAGAAFKDTWTRDDVDDAEHGLLADQEPALYNVVAASRDAHGDSMFSYLIMMGTRLLEMRRILKPTGSIYPHCDPTASHYLKTVMDAVFGAGSFRTDIAWKRSAAHSDTKQGRKQHGRICDSLLFYSLGKSWTWNPVYTEYDRSYIDSHYRHTEPGTGRRYRTGDLTAAKPGGDTQYELRVKRQANGEWEADLDDEWARAPRGGWEYRGIGPYRNRYWAYSREKMRAYVREGRLTYASTGMPSYKRYLDEMPGVTLQDLWTDIPPALGKERTGYPTQKPLALLERIIEASTNPGDMVLDPFCGCATTCVAAETLGRDWVGIDLSPLAVTLVGKRLKDQHGLFGQIIDRTDIPHRTDQGKPAPYRTHRHVLYGEQEGHCNGCRIHFPFRNLTVDHVVPRSKGGSDHRENLQLLCGACNSVKGSGSHAELLAKLKAMA